LPEWEVLTLEGVRYDWPAIAGETLNGRYVLSSFEGEIAGVGRFVSDNQFIDVLPTEAAESAPLAARWQFQSSVSHPNLLSILETGKADLAGVNVVYRVSERPEDSVAGVIAERPMTTDEVDQIVDAVLPALSHLSARGAVYTRLAAPDIVAVGEQVKLALEPVEPAGDRTSRPWRRADIEDVLKGQTVPGFTLKPAPPPPPQRVAPTDARGSDSATSGAPKSDTPIAIVPRSETPLVNARVSDTPRAGARGNDQGQSRDREGAVPPLPNIRGPQPVPPPSTPAPAGVPQGLSTVRTVALVGTALLVVLVLFLVFRGSDPDPAPTVDTTRSSPISPTPTPETQRPAAPQVAGQPVRGWTVIVGAYGREADARKRAASLAPKWPHGPIQVIRSKGRYLLVAATGFNSKADADRMRREARAAGLSRCNLLRLL
jgi:hypothetical protein